MKTIKHILFLISSIGIFSGCSVFDSVWDFTKQRYTNTVSYFNTYYNAERLFDAAENEVLKSQRAALEKPAVGKQITTPIPTTARQKFSQAIEKNSKLLSYYPNSKWVDNSLLMIGKAYYYLDDDVRAERKFLELLAKFSESNKIPEAKLWYGRSLMRMNKTNDAWKYLDELYKSEKIDDDISGLAAFEMGQYYYKQRSYNQAVEYFTSSTKKLSDDEKNATTQLLIADCYLKLGKMDKAQESFEKVSDFSPVYYQLFYSKLQQAKIFTSQKQFNESLEILRTLQSDLKNTEYLASIHFEIANTYLAMGDEQTAFLKYKYVDTAFARTDEAARSYFTIAQVYENKYGLYDSAKLYYEKAKNEFPQSEINTDAAKKVDIFTKYFVLKKELAVTDSLYKRSDSSLIVLDTVSLAKLYIPPQKDTSTTTSKKTVTKKSDPGATDSVKFIDSVLTATYNKKITDRKILIDSLQRQTAKTKFEFGGLFYLEFELPDSALYWYYRVLNEHPATEFAPRSVYIIADIYNSLKKDKTVIDTLYQFLINQYPTSVYAQEARKFLGIPQLILEKDAATDAFLQAESVAVVQTSKGIELYKEIAKKFPSSPVAPKSLFAAGWLYENTLQKNDSALAVYRRLTATYPTSQFALVVKPKIAEFEAELQRIEDEAKELKDKEETERIEAEKKEKELQKNTTTKSQNTVTDTLSVPKF